MNLFLDDIREPKDVHSYTNQKMFLELDWEIVRNYNEFVNWITKNGLPQIISFDHDLAKSHYTPKEYWYDYEVIKQYQESVEHSHTEKTGNQCAQWLVDYCLQNNFKLSMYYVHSMNPVGKVKILNTLADFHKISF